MEHGRRRADQAPLRRGPGAPAAAALRTGRAAALRPGQVVPRRAAAALGVRHLLAPRRRAAVDQPRSHRARGDRFARRRSRTPASSWARCASSSGCPPAAVSRPTRTPPTTRSSSRSCRSTSPRATTSCDDPVERARLVAMFEHGLDTPASYVLPVQVWHSPDLGRRWVTERWGIRRDKLFLMPGDSPAGFRLPLGSLPCAARGRLSARAAARPVRRSRPAAGARRAGAAAARHRGAAGSGAAAKRAERDLRLGAHRARDRAARRSSVRVPAAAQRRARFRRPRRRGRGDGRARPGSPCTSRAMRRRPTRASTSSRSRPTPA